MKTYLKQLVVLFFVYFILLNSLFSNNQIKSQNPPANVIREFRGNFPDRKNVEVRIYFSITNHQIIGVMQEEGQSQTSNIDGYTDSLQARFHIHVLDEFGDSSGVSIDGVFEQNSMKATYISVDKSFEFVFTEIDLSNPPPFQKDGHREFDAYNRLLNDFPPITLPVTLEYEPNGKVITDYTFFSDKEIYKFGVANSEPPITLLQRSNIMRKLMYGGRVDFNNGCKGLILHAYFDSALDGELYASYIFIFDNNDCFAQAFVIYEAIKTSSPYIFTRLSKSQIFNITQYDEEFSFRLSERGESEPLEH